VNFWRMIMAASLPLDEMTVEEKIQAMEALWDDLCRRAGALASPGWHGDVLADREAAIGRGDDEFEEWETAKQKIEKQIP
jgi:hypothetical protein